MKNELDQIVRQFHFENHEEIKDPTCPYCVSKERGDSEQLEKEIDELYG